MEGDEMNTKIKMLAIILISIILIFNLPIYSKAELSIDGIFSGADDFLAQGSQSGAQGINDNELNGISKVVSGILLTIAIAVTVISIAVMGVNFAIQTVEEKAKIKEAMVPWVIGIFVSFGAYGIWKLVMNIFYKI